MLADNGSKSINQRIAVTLSPMTLHDMDEFIRLATLSVELHKPWIYTPSSPDEFTTYLSRFDHETAECLLIRARDTGSIAGYVTITGIARHPYQRGILGYGAFAPTAGQGYMSAGLSAVIQYAFDELQLHRLEADIQPTNTSSINLVKRLRFHKEGYSPGFIRIGGVWKDHERWAITNEMI